MKKYELYLPLEPQALDLALRSALQRLCQGIPELLERVEVTCPIGICHQEQRRRVSRVVLEPLHFLPEPAPKRWLHSARDVGAVAFFISTRLWTTESRSPYRQL